MSIPFIDDREDLLADELRNFQELALPLEPSSGTLPRLPGLDISGRSLPLRGDVGGDHLIYLDFERRYDLGRRIARAEAGGRLSVAAGLRRCQRRGGILVADVSGHRLTDAVIAAMLHQAFLLGVYYELDRFGEITTKLFEHLNQRFYQSTTVNRYITMIYGEISVGGAFRYVAAGHPAPRVFSCESRRFRPLGGEAAVTFPPLGMFPSAADPDELVPPGALGYKARYTVNEIAPLAVGDILLLCTDGLTEHGAGAFATERLPSLLASTCVLRADEIASSLEAEVRAYAQPQDDISFVVVKRTCP